MIKFAKITVLLVLLGAVIAGCKRGGEAEQGAAGDIALSFAVSASSAGQGEAWTRAGGEFLAPDVTFRVVVFNAGDDVSSATPVATGQYVTVGTAGKAIPSTESDRINLTRGTYDIYCYSPSSADYKGIAVAGDMDFMAGTLLAQDVQANAEGQYVVAVELHRLSSKVYVKIVARDFYKTMTLGAGGVTIAGAADGATYVLGGATYATISSTLADVIIPHGAFAVGDPGTLSLTTEHGRGVITWPGSPALAVRMNMTLDGVARDLVAALPAGTVLEAGKQHLVTITITSKGMVDAVAVAVKPWNDGVGESGDGDLKPEELPTLDYTTQPANCYASYLKEGTYPAVKFNALKKPIAQYTAGSATPVNVTGENRSTVIDDAGLENDIVYQEGDKIEVSWQTAVNHGTVGGTANMVVKSITLSNAGIALVGVNGPGNAVLSYKRGGVILWNYHLWVSETNPFENHHPTGGDVNGKVEGGTQAGFMDRYLGALAATTAQPAAADAYKYFGVLYQGGRPTPFSGQGAGTVVGTYTALFDNSGTAISSPIGGYIYINSVASTVTAAIQNPNTYYSKDESWFSVEISLWSDYGLKNKSIYDPCPYGYRVPNQGSWTSWSKPAKMPNGINTGAVYDGSWWPCAGERRSDGTSFNVGATAYAWSSSFYYGTKLVMTYFSPSSEYILQDYAIRMEESLSVRCVQEGY